MENKIEELKEHLNAVREIAKETGLFNPDSLKYEFNDKLIEEVAEINAYFRRLGVSDRFPVTADMVRHKEVFGIGYGDDFIEELREDYKRTLVSMLKYVDMVMDNTKIKHYEADFVEFIKTENFVPSRIRECYIVLKCKSVIIEMKISNEQSLTSPYTISLNHSFLNIKFDIPDSLVFGDNIDHHEGWIEFEDNNPWINKAVNDFETNSKEVAETINVRIDKYIELIENYVKELR